MRIAAFSMLTGRPIVYSGPDTEASETDLAESEIVGGSERADACVIDVTPEAVRTTLRETGLFTSRGPHKLGFAHKTYGEYLAAKYLHNARLPAAQLGSLLFVPGEDPPRLIPQLHEIAAWLASFDREFFAQVAQIEPEVLLQSDVTARDQGTKALLIQSLLGRVERRELSWSQIDGLRPYLHRLRHEALAEQLRTAATDVNRRSETRQLAIEIAEATNLKEMAEVLADLALDPSLDHGLRETAAYAVVNLEVESACKRMKPLALGEAGDDPRDQLRGCGLRATWPRFLTVDALLRCLTPVKQSNFTGANQMFLHSAIIAEQILDADLPQALEWAIGPGSQGRSHEPLTRLAGQLAYRALTHLDNEFVRRALAKLIMRRLKAHIHDIFVDPRERPRLGGDGPQPLELETDLRRLLLDAIVTHSANNDLIYLTFCGFDFARPDDIEWMLHRAVETEADERAKWVRLAGFIFRPFQPDHLEIWQRHKDTCDAVRAMLPWPEAVVLESPKALEMRRRHTEWEDHRRRMEELAARQERLDPLARERVQIVLDRCLDGEPEAFSYLLVQLSLTDEEPHGIGLGPTTVQDHAGWNAADDDTRKRITEAARRYLRHADLDPVDPYQRSERYVADMAPSFAVQLLLDLDPTFLSTLEKTRWELIAPFLLIAPAGNGETRRRAAEQAYRHAPDALRDAAVALIERSGATADWQLVDMLEECLDENLASCVLDFLRREVCSPASFRLLLGWLVRHEIDEARAFAESLLAPRRFGTDQVPRLCAEAAIVLVVYAPGVAWDTLWPPLEQNAEFGRHVLRQVAHDFDSRSGTVAKKLSEQQLRQLIGWLLARYPPTSDRVPNGVHAVGPYESIRNWRDALISHLADRGTPAACTAIQALRDAYPELAWLHDRLLEAQRTRRRMSWMPPSPSELRMLVQDSSFRYVGTATQLLDLVIESIDRYAEELHGTTPAVRNLWDKSRDGGWRPKDEGHLSDNIARHLRRDLRDRGVVVNREVEIRPRQTQTGEAGQETDIHVDATSRGTGADVAKSLTVIIEVKGCWNPQVRDKMKTQLVDRYLKENQCQHGLYLVGWFLCPSWEDADYRKKKTPWKSNEEAERKLHAQAAELTASLGPPADVRAYVLDCALR